MIRGLIRFGVFELIAPLICGGGATDGAGDARDRCLLGVDVGVCFTGVSGCLVGVGAGDGVTFDLLPDPTKLVI